MLFFMLIEKFRMASSAVSSSPPVGQDNLQKRGRDKRSVHHHHHSLPHTRPSQKHADNRQRKLREKRRPANFISTDGTTSGDDVENVISEGNEENPHKLELKKDEQLPSDLDADCEDNNSTDMDTISVSGSVKVKEGDRPTTSGARGELYLGTSLEVSVLNARVQALERQLATVLQVNGKLKEENEHLRKMVNTDD